MTLTVTVQQLTWHAQLPHNQPACLKHFGRPLFHACASPRPHTCLHLLTPAHLQPLLCIVQLPLLALDGRQVQQTAGFVLLSQLQGGNGGKERRSSRGKARTLKGLHGA